MKKIQLLILGMALTVSLFAQKTEIYKNGVLLSKVYSADSIVFDDAQEYTTQDEAQAWAQAHLDSLVDVAWQKVQAGSTPNKRDPDEIREVFRTIGYDGRNVYTYLTAGDLVDSVVTERLIDRALAAGNHTAVLISGNSGAGKSYSTRNNPQVQALIDSAGIVYDETFNGMASLRSTVAHLRDRGFTNIIQVHVYNTAMQSFTNAANRFISSGRVIGLKFFLYLYPCYVNYISTLEEENLTDKRFYIDNSGNDNAVIVTPDVAKKWDYSISEELKQQLTEFCYNFVLENKSKMTYRDAWALLLDE